MQFITVGRFVVNTSLIMSIELYRSGKGSEVKIRGLEHGLRLTDEETATLIGALNPTGGMPTPLPVNEDD